MTQNLINKTNEGNNEAKTILENQLSEVTGESVTLHRRLDMVGTFMIEFDNRMFFTSQEMIIDIIDNKNTNALIGSELL